MKDWRLVCLSPKSAIICLRGSVCLPTTFINFSTRRSAFISRDTGFRCGFCLIGAIFSSSWCRQSMPRRHAGRLVPASLWCFTHSQHLPCRGQSLVQGQLTLLYGHEFCVGIALGTPLYFAVCYFTLVPWALKISSPRWMKSWPLIINF